MAPPPTADTMRDYPSTEGGEGPHLRPSHAALESWTERQSHPPALKDLELQLVVGAVEGILLSVVWAIGSLRGGPRRSATEPRVATPSRHSQSIAEQ